MIAYNTLIVLVGVGLLGAASGLVGCFAVLRGRALLGDALAHAALPGLCLAFLVLGERDLAAMLLGALASGLVGVAVVAALRRWTRVKEDAAIGTVLSVFFGAGVVLSRLIQNRSVEGSKAGLDAYILGKTAGMILADVVLISGLAVAALLLVLLLFKEFQLVSFDTGFAHVQGWPVLRLDLLLTGAVAVTVVIGLPAVGAVMIAALLILPAVAARFWAERLSSVLILSALFGLLTGVCGTAISASASRLPAGPIITLFGTFVFLVSALAAPRRGLVARALAHFRFRRERDQDELLRVLHEQSEWPAVDAEAILRRKAWSPRRLKRLLGQAARRGEVESLPDGTFRLTPSGRERAAEIAERHRRWRQFLTDYPDLAGQARPLDAAPPEAVS